jgi:hypothetical protein
LAGGHQAAGMFVQMRPHASNVLAELGIGVHAHRDNTSGWYWLFIYRALTRQQTRRHSALAPETRLMVRRGV